jgi:hypothetical protein
MRASGAEMMKRKTAIKHISLLIALVMLGITIAACGQGTTPDNPAFFPVQREVATAVPEVLLQGVLTLDGGFLRIGRALILWPYGYFWKTEGNQIQIINGKDEVVARVGEWTKMGGGEIPGYWAEEIIGQPLPAGCEGPYWFAGQIKPD